ncbi:Ubiquitin-conjugating enzyme E2 2, partial [Allomyces javanicus]
MAALATLTRSDQPLPPSPKSMRGQTPAVRRLMWDWKELQADPLDHVVAAPLEGNMFEWHVNLIGPAELIELCPEVKMAQSVWHMVIRFSDFYPARPPSVVLCTSIPGHLNVLGARPRDGLFPVCMDMLETGNLKQTSTHQYTGWSSAYTVRSILMQLQALL